MQELKLGKKPFVPSPKDFKLKEVSVALPPKPRSPFGYGNLYTDWGVLGNDNAGDCVLAGADHEHMLWNKVSKRGDISFTPANALADYSAITGYNPSDPNTDKGTNVRDAMDYRRTTGMIDASGTRHKIDAFVSIDPKNFDLLVRCIWTFGVVGIGFEFPSSAWGQFDSGQVWDVAAGATIDGGHYVPMVGFPAEDRVTFVTWGKRAVMTRAFYEKYNDESWIPLTQESLLPASNVRHIDWSTLSSMLSSL